MKPLGDRRARVRFEVLGSLRATLEVDDVARVVDISQHGALIESAVPVALGSLQELHLNLAGQASKVSARVSRLQLVPPAGGLHESPRYRIGFEFVSPSSLLTDSIARLTDETLG
jgi:PilZ domain